MRSLTISVGILDQRDSQRVIIKGQLGYFLPQTTIFTLERTQSISLNGDMQSGFRLPTIIRRRRDAMPPTHRHR